MMIAPSSCFSLPLQIEAADIDELGHVNNVVYLRWVQEIAAAHWQHLASESQRKAWIWVVGRHEIDYRHSAKLGDDIYARTWVGETEGVRSVRHVQILERSGKLLAEARTTWVLVDPVSLRARKISADIIAVLRPAHGNTP
jgi:acyl-CoA thioester hydrolase